MSRCEQVHPHNPAAARVPLALAPSAPSRAGSSGLRVREGSWGAVKRLRWARGGRWDEQSAREPGTHGDTPVGPHRRPEARHGRGGKEARAAGRAFAKAQRPWDQRSRRPSGGGGGPKTSDSPCSVVLSAPDGPPPTAARPKDAPGCPWAEEAGAGQDAGKPAGCWTNVPPSGHFKDRTTDTSGSMEKRKELAQTTPPTPPPPLARQQMPMQLCVCLSV